MATLTPQPVAWIDTAPVRIRATRELAASPAEVFTALCDHERWPEWFDALSKVERFGEPSEGVGSKRRVFIGSLVQADEEFNAWEPNEAWGFTITKAPPGLRSMNERVTIEPVGDDRCRVTYTMGIDPSPVLAPVLRLSEGLIRKKLGAALEKLGHHIAAERSA